MFFSIAQISSLLLQYKYWLLFPAAVFEGPIITVIAGFMSSTGIFNFFAAYAIIILGDLAGDAFHYALGYWGREKFLNRWGHWIGVDKDKVLRLEKNFEKHGNKMLWVGKASHGIGGIFLVAAGLAKMPFWEFMWSNATATFPKSLILLLVGFFFGQFITRINSIFEIISAVVIGAAIVLAVIYYFYYPGKKSEI